MVMQPGDQPFYQSKDALPDAMGTTAPTPRFGVMGLRLRRPTHWEGAWDTRALEQLEAHLRLEGGVLSEYEQLRAETGGELTYLIDLIIEDERRHHQMLSDIAMVLRAADQGDDGPGASHDLDPVLSESTPETRHQLLAHTERMIELEREDDKALKELADALKPIADTTIWELVVDVLILDTRKHERILKGIEHLIRRVG